MAVNRWVLLLAVPLFLVLAVVAYLTIQFGINERVAQGWVRHTYQVMEAAQRLQSELQTAESSQRGYIIDRDPVYYRTYQQAAARVPGALRSFRAITGDNSVQQQRADRLQKLVADRL
ncbi:MAG: CHASE3 domain-containing protein, partial [Pseudomonadota bacterium]